MELSYFLFSVSLAVMFSCKQVEGLRMDMIIGGHEAELRHFKYIVAVRYKPREGNLPDQNPCTGSIIADMFISTVAHCFYDMRTGTFKNKEFYITFSVINIYNPSLSTTHIRVDLVITPNVYNPLAPSIYNSRGNLAIVKVTRKLGLRAGHNLFKKLRLSRGIRRNANKVYIVAGFGWNEIATIDGGSLSGAIIGRTDGKLRFAHAKALQDFHCPTVSGTDIAIGNMCAKIVQKPGVHRGICQGDSGAPLIFDRDLIGIAISGFPDCNENQRPGIYINIAVYANFINEIMKGNITSHMRVAQLKERNETHFEFERIYL